MILVALVLGAVVGLLALVGWSALIVSAECDHDRPRARSRSDRHPRTLPRV